MMKADVTLENRIERLETFRDLKQGWLDGRDGEPITETAYGNAISFLQNLCGKRDDEIFSPYELPAVFPMEDGGISFEWFTGKILTVEFEPTGKINFFSQTMDTRQAVDIEGLSFDDALAMSKEYLKIMVV